METSQGTLLTALSVLEIPVRITLLSVDVIATYAVPPYPVGADRVGFERLNVVDEPVE